ncbi:MAG: 30S ribosomal protein S6 [Coriobacteriales bacterium]|jgi:small subunit ribosomal protein S6|nr:30S ribosomal protein S6 [Coriobacteriales bacterium]
MKAYELLFFVSPTLEDETREATLARVDAAITQQGGKVDKVDAWGKRKLAFEVDRLTDGDYYLINFHAEPTSIAELDRVLRITDAVIRFIVVCKEADQAPRVLDVSAKE